MEQVAAGLAFAHSKGVVHRDLKPANIHIQPSGQVKIMDFGLARLGGSDLTQTGVVLGTPNYMSPEQALGDKVDARTDVFSAGGVFYELLAGRKPFDAETTPGVLYQVVHKEPTPLRKWAPQVPRHPGRGGGPLPRQGQEPPLPERAPAPGRPGGGATGGGRGAGGHRHPGRGVPARERGGAGRTGRARGLSPAASRPPWVEGQRGPGARSGVATQPRPGAPTLSGRAPTHPGGRGRRAARLEGSCPSWPEPSSSPCSAARATGLDARPRARGPRRRAGPAPAPSPPPTPRGPRSGP